MLGSDLIPVQKKLGIPATGRWDTKTRAAIVAKSPYGHPDPATLIGLGYYDPLDFMSHAQVNYLNGGDPPSTILRDLQSALNQVPRWIWIGLGVTALGTAYLSYRKTKKAG